MDVFRAGAKVDVGQFFQLPDQFLALAVGDMLGKKQTIDQQSQFAVREVAHKIEVRPDVALFRLACLAVRHHADGFAVLDFVAAFHEAEKIPTDRLSVYRHTILRPKDIGDVFLAEPMILVAIAAENIQDAKNQRFLLRMRHVSHLNRLSKQGILNILNRITNQRFFVLTPVFRITRDA